MGQGRYVGFETDQANGSGDAFAMLVRRRQSGESKGVIISLCDLTGVMVAPWVDGGYDAVLVDPQHPAGVNVEPAGSGALIARVGAVVDSSVTWAGVRALIHGGAVVFISGFPVCTQLAVSGTARWADKRAADPHFQAKAMALVHECRVIGELSGAPYFFENPVSAISSIYRKPDHAFHPNEYGGYLPEDDCHPLYPGYIERVRQRRDYRPEQKRRWQLKTRYKLNPEQVQQMRSAQRGRCGVCRLELKREHIDHDHDTGKVRGIVCHRCNIRLGGWDDRIWRESAAAWLGFSIVANEEGLAPCA